MYFIQLIIFDTEEEKNKKGRKITYPDCINIKLRLNTNINNCLQHGYSFAYKYTCLYLGY